LTDPSCEVTECNCSICSRNGYLLIYVKDSDVVFENGTEDDFKVCSPSRSFHPPFQEQIQTRVHQCIPWPDPYPHQQKYTFAPKHGAAHYFCPHCGTSCFIKPTDPNFLAGMKAVNVRTFAGVDLKSLTLKFADGKSI
jgi:hypothetical protein